MLLLLMFRKTCCLNVKLKRLQQKREPRVRLKVGMCEAISFPCLCTASFLRVCVYSLSLS